MTRDPHSSLCLPLLLVAAVLFGVANLVIEMESAPAREAGE